MFVKRLLTLPCDLKYLNQLRYMCYKSIKRPNHKLINSTFTKNKLEVLPLSTHLKSKIEFTGPLTIAAYMKEVLTNPNSGYYMSKDVFGEKGDFITSPEINQIFGELIAVWALANHQKVGGQTPLQIIELGAGRGSLIQDFLRVCAHFKLSESTSVHLVEMSPYLSKLQSQRLCHASNEVDENSNLPYYRVGETLTGVKVFWYQRVQDIPEDFSIIIANEFFDAMPVHKLKKDNNVWKEVLVDVDPDDQSKLRYVLSKNETPISKLYSTLYPNDSRNDVEVSPETDIIVNYLAERLERNGGFGLIIDYGHFGDESDTFRAFKNHKLHDPLIDPGTADLTADVDFKNIKSICEHGDKLITFGPIDQGTFLKNMEAEARLEILLSKSRPAEQEILKSGYDMLVNPDKMGQRFKFFAMFPSVLRDHLSKYKVEGF
ncbi:unnamed protein product [Diamesa tonsa]